MGDYEALKQAAIAYLRLPTNVTRRELAELVGEPYDEPIEGAFMAARGALKWEEGDEKPEDAIRRLRDSDAIDYLGDND